MIDTLGWPTLAERRLKTRLIMMYKITHALIAITMAKRYQRGNQNPYIEEQIYVDMCIRVPDTTAVFKLWPH
jgi:hypothetical protein